MHGVYSVHRGYIHLAHCREAGCKAGNPRGGGEERVSRPSGEAARRRGSAAGSAWDAGRPLKGQDEEHRLDIIISNASDKPIYEQITAQMKSLILNGTLAEGAQLPSMRALANDLRISVITTKRAYADLEAQGFIETVQGKGSFVAGGNMELLREERLKHIEDLMARAVEEARSAGVAPGELHDMLDLLMED